MHWWFSSFSERLPSLTINRITHEERLINFCVLLGQNGQKVQEMNLPSNEETQFDEKKTILLKYNIQKLMLIKSMLHSGHRKTNIYTWYIGHCMGNNNDGTYKI